MWCRAEREAGVADRQLAQRLGVPAVGPGLVPDDALVVARVDGHLELREPGDRPGRGVFIDTTEWGLRPGAGGLGQKQPLAKAVGRNTTRVVDATAGLGRDAMLLAARGLEVVAIERNPIVAALLEDAIERVRITLAAEGRTWSLSLVAADARVALEALDPAPETVYIDPMFPLKRKKSALTKKGVRLLRELAGDDPDAADLLAAAREVATGRVVVKRPTHAEPLAPEPDLHFDGKLARYDVYLSP